MVRPPAPAALLQGPARPPTFEAGRSLHVDGKAANKAAATGQRIPMLLSARGYDGTVATQLPIDTKTKEIPMFAPH